MAIPDWPTTLPQVPLEDGYSSAVYSNVVSDPDGSIFISSRRRSALDISYHSVTFKFSKAELLIFQDFYENTLGGGILPFNILDPIGQSIDMKARINSNNDSAYSLAYDGDTREYLVSFTLEQLP
jgi:hypothetical protein